MNQLATKPIWRKKEGKNHSKVSNQQHSTKRVSTVKSAEESSAAIQPQVSRAWRNWYVFNHTTGFLKQAIFTYFAEKSSFTFILHFLLPLHCIVLLFAKCLRVCTNLWLVLGVGVAIDYRFVAIGGWCHWRLMNGRFLWGIGNFGLTQRASMHFYSFTIIFLYTVGSCTWRNPLFYL